MAPGGQRHHVQTIAIREGRLRPSLRIATRQGARRKALALASLTIEQSGERKVSDRSSTPAYATQSFSGGSPLLQQRELDFSPAEQAWREIVALATGIRRPQR